MLYLDIPIADDYAALADGGVTFADQAGADTYGVADEVARRVLSAGG